MNSSATEQELSDNYNRRPVTPNCITENLNATPPLTHTFQIDDFPFKKPICRAPATLSRRKSLTFIKEINHSTNCNEIIATSNTLSQSSSNEKDHILLTEENNNSGSSANKRQRWDLASFVFPDNSLPQSWLDIMEANKKMKPFDNLQTQILNTNISVKVPKTQTVNTVPLNKPCTSKSIAPLPPPVVENAHTESASTEENMDQELSLMPELTLSIPERYSGDSDIPPSDFEKEIFSFAPKIEPYDPKITEQLPKFSKPIRKVISSVRIKEKEGKANTSKANTGKANTSKASTSKENTSKASITGKANKGKVSTGKKPKTEIQLRVIETRRTKKLELLKALTTQKVPIMPTSCKSMKKKSNSVLQQQPNINKRIQAQISIMQLEAKKKSPDLELLRRKMCLEETFKYRMAKFMKDEQSIEDLLKEFPALKIKPIVMDEFERIVENTNPMVRCNPINFLEKALQKRFQRIVSRIRTLPHQIPLLTDALRKLDKDPKNERLKQVVCAVSMIMTFSVDKSISSVIALKKEKETFCYQNIGLPKLVLKEKFILKEKTNIQVYLEGQEIFKVANVYEGLLAIFAISHVFNLDYEKLIEPLMRYFEFLVDIPQLLYQEEDPFPSDDEI